ncbi:MAG: hypothetical protein K9N46_13620 [Candidatus Marinimicrobia bacterium]|nr:hypothetical protein [Candidatus Neomarinimicrobiota bacterium]MCF7829801.1 hypothetical protein [Candidatus Neomarinimicrobiota bacterium]MCF7881766.1 hypothetical protein [Candidatus Neomarinimicrobiota bacterium]
MRKFIISILAGYTVFLLTLGYPGMATGLTIAEATVEEVTTESDLVVYGTVTDQFSQWDATGRNIYTYNAIRISEVLRGEGLGTTVVVRELGGKVGPDEARVNGLRYLRDNEEVVLFLRKTDDENVYKIHSFSLGLFLATEKDGQTVFRNASGKVRMMDTDGTAKSSGSNQENRFEKTDLFRRIRDIK